MEALAEAYGTLFAETHRDWTLAQVQSAEEALPDGTTIPDQDQRHRKINSAILRQLRSHLYADESPTALPEKLASRLLNRTVSDQLNGRRNAIHNLHLNEKGSIVHTKNLAKLFEQEFIGKRKKSKKNTKKKKGKKSKDDKSRKRKKKSKGKTKKSKSKKAS